MVLVLVTSYQRQVCYSKSWDIQNLILIITMFRVLDAGEHVEIVIIRKVMLLVIGGFDSDVSSIISALPSSRQTLLFTATNSDAISSVIQSCKNNPFVWSSPDLGLTSTVDKLEQRFVLTPIEARDPYLVQLLLSRREADSKFSILYHIF